MTETTKAKKRRCFNCKESSNMNRPVFCDDCWRMALIFAAFGGVNGEVFHKLLKFLFP